MTQALENLSNKLHFGNRIPWLTTAHERQPRISVWKNSAPKWKRTTDDRGDRRTPRQGTKFYPILFCIFAKPKQRHTPKLFEQIHQGTLWACAKVSDLISIFYSQSGILGGGLLTFEFFSSPHQHETFWLVRRQRIGVRNFLIASELSTVLAAGLDTRLLAPPWIERLGGKRRTGLEKRSDDVGC